MGSETENVALITEHFPFFGKAYITILNASRAYTPGLEAIFYNAHNEFTWQYTVLLAPLVINDDDETLRRKMEATATYLDIWLMRRTVNYIRVGYSSTSYAMHLLCRDIRGKSLPDLVALLSHKLAQEEVTFDGDLNRGRTGIAGLGLNQFSRRYIYHLLARVTAYVEVGAGKPDLFDKYVDRTSKNPFDLEHIWADDHTQYGEEFPSEEEFQQWRNHVARLLILPADVNRSYQNKPFDVKAPHYAKQNLYAASLTASTYQHQPQFRQFQKSNDLSFRPYDKFGKTEQLERRSLIRQLVESVWSPERLNGFLE